MNLVKCGVTREGQNPSLHLPLIKIPTSFSTTFNNPSPSFIALRKAVTTIYNLDDFQLEPIGSGFFSNVYKATHKTNNNVMVLKLNINKQNSVNVRREIQLMNRLSHPNIIKFFGVCVIQAQIHALVEFINGGTLEQLLSNQSLQLPWTLRIQIACDIAKGLKHLHSIGFMHRDLTSKNILVKRGPQDKMVAVVADLGLADKIPSLIQTTPPSIVGSPYWMAPECINGFFYNEKADVFSYGIVLCEIIARIQADPDILPRTKKFGVDYVEFCRMTPNCPLHLLYQAFICCQVDPNKRPNFRKIVNNLQILKCSAQMAVILADLSRLGIVNSSKNNLNRMLLEKILDEKIKQRKSTNNFCSLSSPQQLILREPKLQRQKFQIKNTQLKEKINTLKAESSNNREVSSSDQSQVPLLNQSGSSISDNSLRFQKLSSIPSLSMALNQTSLLTSSRSVLSSVPPLKSHIKFVPVTPMIVGMVMSKDDANYAPKKGNPFPEKFRNGKWFEDSFLDNNVSSSEQIKIKLSHSNKQQKQISKPHSNTENFLESFAGPPHHHPSSSLHYLSTVTDKLIITTSNLVTSSSPNTFTYTETFTLSSNINNIISTCDNVNNFQNVCLPRIIQSKLVMNNNLNDIELNLPNTSTCHPAFSQTETGFINESSNCNICFKNIQNIGNDLIVSVTRSHENLQTQLSNNCHTKLLSSTQSFLNYKMFSSLSSSSVESSILKDCSIYLGLYNSSPSISSQNSKNLLFDKTNFSNFNCKSIFCSESQDQQTSLFRSNLFTRTLLTPEYLDLSKISSSSNLTPYTSKHNSLLTLITTTESHNFSSHINLSSKKYFDNLSPHPFNTISFSNEKNNYIKSEDVKTGDESNNSPFSLSNIALITPSFPSSSPSSSFLSTSFFSNKFLSPIFSTSLPSFSCNVISSSSTEMFSTSSLNFPLKSPYSSSISHLVSCTFPVSTSVCNFTYSTISSFSSDSLYSSSTLSLSSISSDFTFSPSITVSSSPLSYDILSSSSQSSSPCKSSPLFKNNFSSDNHNEKLILANKNKLSPFESRFGQHRTFNYEAMSGSSSFDSALEKDEDDLIKKNFCPIRKKHKKLQNVSSFQDNQTLKKKENSKTEMDFKKYSKSHSMEFPRLNSRTSSVMIHRTTTNPLSVLKYHHRNQNVLLSRYLNQIIKNGVKSKKITQGSSEENKKTFGSPPANNLKVDEVDQTIKAEEKVNLFVDSKDYSRNASLSGDEEDEEEKTDEEEEDDDDYTSCSLYNYSLENYSSSQGGSLCSTDEPFSSSLSLTGSSTPEINDPKTNNQSKQKFLQLVQNWQKKENNFYILNNNTNNKNNNNEKKNLKRLGEIDDLGIGEELNDKSYFDVRSMQFAEFYLFRRFQELKLKWEERQINSKKINFKK